MKLQIEAPFQLSAPMETLVNEKVNKLSTFFERIISVHIYFKDEVQRFQHKDQRTVEIRVEVPGHSLFASDSAETFEQAIANAAQKMQRQLKKHKESLSSH